MTRRHLFLVGLTSLACLGLAQGDGQIPPIVEQAAKASKNLRYRGERRIQLRFGPDLVQHTEYILKDKMRTRIWFPDEGSYRGQIIVENESERRHYFPDRNQIDVLPPRREENIARWGKMGKQGRPQPVYRVEDGGQIAGIATKQVEMSGGNGFVFMRMWIDPKTGLVLKRTIYNKSNQPQAVAEFTKVEFNPRFQRGDFELAIRNAKIITPRDRLAELIQRGSFQNVSFAPKDLYKLESSRIQRIDNVPALVQVYVRRDGRVSLYQVKAQIDPEKLRRSGRGEKVGAYSWQKAGTSFVLLGDLPESKLRELAQRLGG
jgi:outer membrane lipoprotein-sorting protein